MICRFRPIRKQVPDLRIFGSARLHHADQIGVRTGLGTILHVAEKHWLHVCDFTEIELFGKDGF